jgi:hypothetical protein
MPPPTVSIPRSSSWKSPATKRAAENKQRLSARAQARFDASQRAYDARPARTESERAAKEEKRLREMFGDLIR